MEVWNAEHSLVMNKSIKSIKIITLTKNPIWFLPRNPQADHINRIRVSPLQAFHAQVYLQLIETWSSVKRKTKRIIWVKKHIMASVVQSLKEYKRIRTIICSSCLAKDLPMKTSGSSCLHLSHKKNVRKKNKNSLIHLLSQLFYLQKGFKLLIRIQPCHQSLWQQS